MVAPYKFNKSNYFLPYTSAINPLIKFPNVQPINTDDPNIAYSVGLKFHSMVKIGFKNPITINSAASNVHKIIITNIHFY